MDILNFVAIYVVAVFCRTLFTIKIISEVLYVRLHWCLCPEFQNFILYNHVNWIKFLTCQGGRIIHEKFPLVFCQNLSCFVLCILWSFNLILFYSFEISRMYITKFTSWTTQNKICLKDSIAAWIIFVLLMSLIEKEMGESFVLKFFHREWRNTKLNSIQEWWRP